jgi:hypothetical protein
MKTGIVVPKMVKYPGSLGKRIARFKVVMFLRGYKEEETAYWIREMIRGTWGADRRLQTDL